MMAATGDHTHDDYETSQQPSRTKSTGASRNRRTGQGTATSTQTKLKPKKASKTSKTKYDRALASHTHGYVNPDLSAARRRSRRRPGTRAREPIKGKADADHTLRWSRRTSRAW